MSAWMVTKTHIDVLVTAALAIEQGGLSYFWKGSWRRADFTRQDEVGKMLWSENYRSVAHRYPDDLELPGAYLDGPGIDDYTYVRQEKRDPVTVLKTIDCFEYQSCEHDEWEQSEAWAFCKYLRLTVITTLPGYQEAPWGISDLEAVS